MLELYKPLVKNNKFIQISNYGNVRLFRYSETNKDDRMTYYKKFNRLNKNGSIGFTFTVITNPLNNKHYLNVNKDGIIDLKELESSITKNTILISIMRVNNIVGSIQPIKKIIDIVKKFPRIKFHSDLVQGITKIKPNFNLNDLDFFTIFQVRVKHF